MSRGGGGRSDRPPMQYPMESMFTMGMSHSRMRLTGAGEGEAAWWRGEGEREPGVEQRDVVKHHEDLALRGVFSLRADEVPQVDLRRRQEISAGGRRSRGGRHLAEERSLVGDGAHQGREQLGVSSLGFHRLQEVTGRVEESYRRGQGGGEISQFQR